MIWKTTAIVIAIATLAVGTSWADPRMPDAGAVIRAFFATTNVGNVEASLAFFTDDGYHMLPGGKKYSGKDELRNLFSLFARENVRFEVPADASVKGETATFHMDVSTKWLVELGIAPTTVVHVATVDGNRIKAWYAYYPQQSLTKMKQACDTKPEVLAPNRPCGESIQIMKTHLDDLIAKGLAEKE
jgi:limonene-1,2-epoxide hydrolase